MEFNSAFKGLKWDLRKCEGGVRILFQICFPENST